MKPHVWLEKEQLSVSEESNLGEKEMLPSLSFRTVRYKMMFLHFSSE